MNKLSICNSFSNQYRVIEYVQYFTVNQKIAVVVWFALAFLAKFLMANSGVFLSSTNYFAPKGEGIKKPELGGIGFQNMGDTCFMNASLQGFLARKDIRRVLDVDLRRSRGESILEFENRYKLQGYVIALYNQVISKKPDSRLVGEAISQIANSPLFARNLRIRRSQEDAEEFLRLLMTALDVGEFKETSLQVRGVSDWEMPAALVQLESENPGDVTVGDLVRNKEWAHEDVGVFRGVSMQLPRTTMNYRGAVKTFRKISNLLDPVMCTVFDFTKKVDRFVQLTPDAIVCHLGGRFGNSGHYVTVVRKQDVEGNLYFIEKNDSRTRILSEEEANRLVETSGYIVYYSASVGIE